MPNIFRQIIARAIFAAVCGFIFGWLADMYLPDTDTVHNCLFVFSVFFGFWCIFTRLLRPLDKLVSRKYKYTPRECHCSRKSGCGANG